MASNIFKILGFGLALLATPSVAQAAAGCACCKDCKGDCPCCD